MRFNVEMTIEEKGLVRVEKGYLRDSDIELKDLLKWTKSQLIFISDQVLTEEQSKGFDKKPIVIVDGIKNKPVKDVSPLGRIEFVARQYLGDVLSEAYKHILDLSKVRTGRYKSSHFVFQNTKLIATSLESLQAWEKSGPTVKDSDKIIIVNTQPYARKLELKGVTSKGQQSRREDKGRRRGVKTGITVVKPNGAYQMASRRVKNKYKNNVSINFRFIPGDKVGDGIKGAFKRGKDDRSIGRPYLYPALVFRVGDGGGLL